jgi:hypothetical protein
MCFKKWVLLCIALVTFFHSNGLLAQSPADSAQADVEQIDTVRVKKKVFVNKIVYAPPVKKENVFFISGYAGVFSEQSYYKVCESCTGYFDKVQAATSKMPSYNYGLSFSYSRNQLYFSAGLEGSIYRQKFQYTDSLAQTYSATNELKTLALSALGGYWFRKDKNGLSFMLLAGASYGALYAISGNTLSRKHSDRVVELKDEIEYFPTQVIINGTIRILYPVVKKIKIFGDLFYGYDIKTFIKTSEIVQQRNMYGLKIGCHYLLR